MDSCKCKTFFPLTLNLTILLANPKVLIKTNQNGLWISFFKIHLQFKSVSIFPVLKLVGWKMWVCVSVGQFKSLTAWQLHFPHAKKSAERNQVQVNFSLKCICSILLLFNYLISFNLSLLITSKEHKPPIWQLRENQRELAVTMSLYGFSQGD